MLEKTEGSKQNKGDSKGQGFPTGDNLFKSFQYFYYDSEFQEKINKKFEGINLNEVDTKEKSFDEVKEESIKDKIERKIKNKYNLLIPAIFIEIAENGKNSIEFQKEDLNNLLTSLGGIKHIEINGGIAYVLYEHYFSALLAFNVLNEIITSDNKRSITVKLFTKEEDEEKQKKMQDKDKEKTKSNKDGSRSNLLHLTTEYAPKSLIMTNIFERKVENIQKAESDLPRQEGRLNLNINATPYHKSNTGYDIYSPIGYSFKESPTYSESFFLPDQMSSLSISHQPEMLSYPIPCMIPIPTPKPLNINFSTAQSRLYVVKYVCNYDIQIENDGEFQVTRRLIGNKGAFLRKILYDCCIKYNDNSTKIRLRGKGSGYKEGSELKESDDPLQLCVSSLNLYNYSKCCQLVEHFLNQIYYEYFVFLFNRKRLVESSPKKISKYEYVINRF